MTIEDPPATLPPSGSATSASPAFLSGGGRMGALMRSMDWSATPLGPVGQWPQSLRTSVSTCLNSRFPILLWWGKDLCKIYNDAYQPIIGQKHPRAMGQRGRDCWPEIWDVIGPMLEGVMQRGEATWSENQMLPLERYGYPEECYFTFAYSPIRDESGRVGGVFSVVRETTRQVLGERRLRTLRMMAADSAETKGEVDACQAALQALAQNPQDVPFAAAYLCERGEPTAFLAASFAMPGEPASASRFPWSDAAAPWPFVRAAAERRALRVDGARRPLDTESHPDARPLPNAAVVVPFGPPDAPSGFLVAGLSPRLAFDEEYQGFLGSAASQLGTAVASARAFDDAMERAEQLAALDRAKTTFFTNVSHEFRTPLTLMLGPLEDALTDPPHALAGEPLRSAYRNTQRLLKLVNALLDFSRIESGRMQAHFRPTDLASATRDIASAFRSTIEAAGLVLEVECEGDATAWVDRDMWEKIVLNLLSNAYKFTLEGRIRVRLDATGDGIALEVSDTGSGIAAADIAKLFQRFQRIDNASARTQEGSGIGLALVQELAQMHGAGVAVASEPGRGSTFRVTLRRGCGHLPPERLAQADPRTGVTAAVPFVEEAEGWAREDALVLPGPESPPSTESHGRVLVVDDNADMRRYIARLLSQHWAVECVADGRAALRTLEKGGFDLVLTDVMMPGMNGFELMKAVRARNDAIPVIMLSARAGEEARIEGLDAGADDYLVKPFGGRELVARVRSQLQLKRNREELAAERLEFAARERAARREAELQKEHLQALMMQAPTPMCILRGPRHVIEVANSEICRVWRRPHEQVINRPILEALPEIREQGFEALLDRVVATGESYIGREATARLASSATGELETVYLNFVYAPLKGVGGEVEGVLVIAFDITQEVEHRRSVSHLQAQAEAASQAKDEFLAMLGHELRNPLSPIVTALQLMRLRGVACREQDVIERQVAALQRLVDDLLDVSRITRGTIELRTSVVETAEVIAQAVETASPLLEKRAHRFTMQVPTAGLPIVADPGRMSQDILNLLTTAARYSAAGSEIRLEARAIEGRVRIAVRDRGIGIAPDMLDKVFEPFVQQSRKLEGARGGLGLGLAIVRNLVELHGGEVGVTSRLGEGSEFVVTLPLADGKMRDADAPAADPRPLSTASASMRVLIVDDNEDAALLLKDLLQELGYAIHVAHDGPAALDVAASFRPQVAILDIGLPVMDGYELGERLRGLLGPGLRLVAVTGFSQESDRRRSDAAGFARHLVKPVDAASVAQVLRELSPAKVD